MPKVISYLECGCALLDGGGIVRCPKHDEKVEGIGASRQLCPYHPEVDYKVAWGCPECLQELRRALRYIATYEPLDWTQQHLAVAWANMKAFAENALLGFEAYRW